MEKPNDECLSTPALRNRLARDICLFIHEQADYRSLMPDLDYAGNYNLAYWAIASHISPDDDDAHFLQTGCLMLMLAMIWAELDGSGTWILRHRTHAVRCLRDSVPCDEEILRLLNTVEQGLEILKTPPFALTDRFEENTAWAFDRFVGGYFIERANFFERSGNRKKNDE